MLYNALKLAVLGHEGQKRKYDNKDQDYIYHSLAVYNILRLVTTNSDVLCAGLLHDVIEDTKYTYNDIKDECGVNVANIVLEVTKNKSKGFDIRTKEGLMVKLADTLHNISDNSSVSYLNKKLYFINQIKD